MLIGGNMKKSVLVNDNATGLSISLDRGPYQNNSASLGTLMLVWELPHKR